MNKNEWRYEITEFEFTGYRLIAKHYNGDMLIVYGSTKEEVFVNFTIHLQEFYEESLSFLEKTWKQDIQKNLRHEQRPKAQENQKLELKYGLLN